MVSRYYISHHETQMLSFMYITLQKTFTEYYTVDITIVLNYITLNYITLNYITLIILPLH